MVYITYLFVLSSVIDLTTAGVSMHNPFYCYSEDSHKPQIGMFSVFTPYEIIRGQTINANVSTCSPSKFWMLSSYGTRLPTPNDMPNMLSNYARLHSEILDNFQQGRTALCAADIELLRNWSIDPNITLENAQHLTPAGWDEIEGLAQRYQAAFPSLLPSTYLENDYFFRSTSTDMTQRSLHAFADGLFGGGGHEQVRFEDLPERDYFLLPYQNCPLWDEVSDTDGRAEQNAFRDGPEFQEMTLQASAKFGFHGSRVLRTSEIDLLQSVCRYEQIWYMDKNSTFCAGFSVANHQDMLRFLQSNDVNDQKAKIFSTNNAVFLMFLLHFGVYEDNTPLTRHNFAQQTNRLWNSSMICPMAANLAIIRYDCADGDNDILFLHNEKPLHVVGCEPNGLCKQSKILERFNRFLNANCVETFCSTL